MRPYQTFKKLLRSFAVTQADVGTTLRAPLDELITKYQGDRVLHVTRFIVEAAITPTYTTAPTEIGHASFFAQVRVYDGKKLRTQLSGNALRQAARVEYGRYPVPEPILGNGSTNPRYMHRDLWFGPPNFLGSPSDFMIPAAFLAENGGTVEIDLCQLTDMSADCTAFSATIYVTAEYAIADEVNLPPFFERRTQIMTNDDKIKGRALYAYLAFSRSSAYGNFAAGELGAWTVEGTEAMPLMTALNSSALSRAFNSEKGASELGGIQGEPRNATYDVNLRRVNGTTPTALTALQADLQPVIWYPNEMRSTKIIAAIPDTLLVRTSGTISSGLVAHIGRFLPQDPLTDRSQMADLVAKKMGKPVNIGFKTLSKDQYKGPYQEYMPWKGKLGKAA